MVQAFAPRSAATVYGDTGAGPFDPGSLMLALMPAVLVPHDVEVSESQMKHWHFQAPTLPETVEPGQNRLDRRGT